MSRVFHFANPNKTKEKKGQKEKMIFKHETNSLFKRLFCEAETISYLFLFSFLPFVFYEWQLGSILSCLSPAYYGIKIERIPRSGDFKVCSKILNEIMGLILV